MAATLFRLKYPRIKKKSTVETFIAKYDIGTDNCSKALFNSAQKALEN
jgi:hypothetical protein